MTASRESVVFVPAPRGRAALAELAHVPWSTLAHAYGVGVTGPRPWDDVAGSLRGLGDAATFEDAASALYSNVCHQGTIYEATAPAVPFLAAVGADPELWIGHARMIALLLAEIAIASSFATEDGTMSGSFGDDVGPHTRAAFVASAPLLAEMAGHFPSLAAIEQSIAAVVRADPPKRAHLDAVAEAMRELEALDVGDPPRPPPPPLAEQWVAHAKFGVGLVVRHEEGKLRVRFTDGTERVLLERFLVPASRPD